MTTSPSRLRLYSRGFSRVLRHYLSNLASILLKKAEPDRFEMVLFSACLCGLIFLTWGRAAGAGPPTAIQERMVEWTVESQRAYADPFNDVDVDVIFTKGGKSWRVPTFWRGSQQ